MKHKPPHKLTRVTLGKHNDYILYKCTIRGCTHNIQPQLLVGRETVCNECEIPFIVETYKDLIKVLKCKTCRSKEEVDMDDVEKVIERLRQ